MIENAGRNIGCQRPAALINAVDPQAERRRVDVPPEQPAGASDALQVFARMSFPKTEATLGGMHQGNPGVRTLCEES